MARRYKVHPAANLFPMMDEEAFQRLKEDIRLNGLQESITLWREQLVDGRNRQRACEELGIDPDPNELDDNADPVAFVLSMNLHRRHLTPSQLATVGVALEKLYAERAKEREKERKSKNGQTTKANSPESPNGQARDQAAAALGIGGRIISDAKAIASESPDLFKQVQAGAITVNKAKSQLKPKKPRKKSPPKAKAAAPSSSIREESDTVVFSPPDNESDALQWLRHWWSKADDSERDLFLEGIGARRQ